MGPLVYLSFSVKRTGEGPRRAAMPCSLIHPASLLHEFGDGYKAIASSGEMLSVDSGREGAVVSALIDSRRVVALQVLCVSV
eukprot:2146847-Prymnesium_polylepis.2